MSCLTSKSELFLNLMDQIPRKEKTPRCHGLIEHGILGFNLTQPKSAKVWSYESNLLSQGCSGA